MGRSYDTGIDVRTCAYIQRPFWHLSIIPLLKGGAKSPFVQKFKFSSPGTVSIPHTGSACQLSRSSKIDIKILYSATVREILSFFYPSKSVAIIPLLLADASSAALQSKLTPSFGSAI
jgi:hypothetical protein